MRKLLWLMIYLIVSSTPWVIGIMLFIMLLFTILFVISSLLTRNILPRKWFKKGTF